MMRLTSAFRTPPLLPTRPLSALPTQLRTPHIDTAVSSALMNMSKDFSRLAISLAQVSREAKSAPPAAATADPILAAIKALSDDVATLKNDLPAEVMSHLTTPRADKTALVDVISQISSAIDDVKTRLDGISTNQTTATTSIATITDDVRRLDASVAAVNTSLGRLTTRLTLMETAPNQPVPAYQP